MSAAGAVCRLHTRCFRNLGIVVAGLQEMARKAATASKNLGIRRLETSCGIDTAPCGEPTNVDVIFWSVDCKTVDER